MELLRQDKKLPRLGYLFHNWEKEMAKTTAERPRRKKDKRTIYIFEKYACNFRPNQLHKIAKDLAKQYCLGWIRVRMCRTRHRSLNKMLLADCANKVMERIVYITTGLKKMPKNECSCKGSKVDEKCMFNNKCQEQTTIYKVTWNPTTRHYLVNFKSKQRQE